MENWLVLILIVLASLSTFCLGFSIPKKSKTIDLTNEEGQIQIKRTVTAVNEERNLSRYRNEHIKKVFFDEGNGIIDFPPESDPEIGDICTITLHKKKKMIKYG